MISLSSERDRLLNKYRDAIVHCKTEEEARAVLEAIRGRFAECGLVLHPTKTKIVYCKDDDRPGEYEHTKFDFLGYCVLQRHKERGWVRVKQVS
jgi:hypothetical protein